MEQKYYLLQESFKIINFEGVVIYESGKVQS